MPIQFVNLGDTGPNQILFLPNGKIAFDPECCCGCNCLSDDSSMFVELTGVADGLCSDAASELNNVFEFPRLAWPFPLPLYPKIPERQFACHWSAADEYYQPPVPDDNDPPIDGVPYLTGYQRMGTCYHTGCCNVTLGTPWWESGCEDYRIAGIVYIRNMQENGNGDPGDPDEWTAIFRITQWRQFETPTPTTLCGNIDQYWHSSDFVPKDDDGKLLCEETIPMTRMGGTPFTPGNWFNVAANDQAIFNDCEVTLNP